MFERQKHASGGSNNVSWLFSGFFPVKQFLPRLNIVFSWPESVSARQTLF